MVAPGGTYKMSPDVELVSPASANARDAKAPQKQWKLNRLVLPEEIVKIGGVKFFRYQIYVGGRDGSGPPTLKDELCPLELVALTNVAERPAIEAENYPIPEIPLTVDEHWQYTPMPGDYAQWKIISNAAPATDRRLLELILEGIQVLLKRN